MAIPRFAATMLGQVQAAQAARGAGPGTITKTYQDYMKSPVLSGLAGRGTTGLYRTGQAPRDFYKAKTPMTPEKLAELRAQMATTNPATPGVAPTGAWQPGPATAPVVAPPQAAPAYGTAIGQVKQNLATSPAGAPLVGGNKFFNPAV